MVRSVFGDYMMFLRGLQPYVTASDTPEIKNLLKKIDQKGVELQRAIKKANQTRLGDDDKAAIDAKYEEQDIDGDRKILVDKVIKLRNINMKKVEERDQKKVEERRKAKTLVAFKPAPAKKVVAKKVMKAPVKKKMMKMVGTMYEIKKNDTSEIKREIEAMKKFNAKMNSMVILRNETKNEILKQQRVKILNDMETERQKMVKKIIDMRTKLRDIKKPAPKKVVAKVMKPAMKKPMKKPIAYGNVETALTGKRPRKAPAKPKQVARFYVGGSVLPKGTKAPMPKKTTTMKARKPMSAETKAKIKKGVQKYHKNCKKAMAMYSKMKK